jgi:ketosteroid isomerase-like protein
VDQAAGAGGPKPELIHGFEARARCREPYGIKQRALVDRSRNYGITRAHSSTGAQLIPRLPLASRFRHDGGKAGENSGEGTISGREDMERTLRDAYAARQRGDLDALGRLFAPHARFQMAGSSASPIATLVEGAEQYRPLLAGMIKTFEVLDHRIVSMLIDGSKAAVQWRAKMRSAVTGETVDTDLFDLIEMEGGRITSFLEFCDTALAARMMKH